MTFEGHQYPLSIGGISAGATIGASGTDLVGTASHMHAPGDIEGVYSAIGAGLSIAGGRSAAQLSNARGVVLRLQGAADRLHVLDRSQRHEHIATLVTGALESAPLSALETGLGGVLSARNLPVIGAGPVLALEMLVQKLLFDRLEVRLQLKRHQSHVGDAFDGDRGLQRFRGARSPRERRMPIDENARTLRRIAGLAFFRR